MIPRIETAYRYDTSRYLDSIGGGALRIGWARLITQEPAFTCKWWLLSPTIWIEIPRFLRDHVSGMPLLYVSCFRLAVDVLSSEEPEQFNCNPSSTQNVTERRSSPHKQVVHVMDAYHRPKSVASIPDSSTNQVTAMSLFKTIYWHVYNCYLASRSVAQANGNTNSSTGTV